ncbi:translation protein SH3-like domain-containing protein [Mucor lusitanicus]|uniref:Large ribosomal subunit protein uL2m n=2 Tax=Mucor circinelloides f. lusitanicus TaxID=29924 RepID=A0A162U2G8_MUCCL|nr:translation protein SH3-like domain-containing protein [Mucor lusitanicus]OAD08952.1 hypothetical protein MUCCIDRAFT_155063 [Mucor lusitanicus CBS 277.49]
MFRLGRVLQHATSKAPTVFGPRVCQPSSSSNMPSLIARFSQMRTYTSSNKPPVESPSFLTGFNTQGNAMSSIKSSASPSSQFKTKKPTTPGKRWLKRVPRDHLYKGKAVRSLTVAKRSSGGRNNTGRITIRHRGGGHKRRIRVLDWHRQEAGSQTVMRLEHDPGRTAWIALLKNDTTGKLSYIIAPHGIKAGDKVTSYRQQQQEEQNPEDPVITRTVAVDAGNCMPLKMIPVGTILHNIGLKRNGPAVMARAAGAYAQLIQTGETGYAQVRLSSGEVRLVPVDACATIGAVSNPDHQHEMLGKAGRSRWLGIRPTVRGMAMNACDHPHGGGRGKSKGNKDPRSPWGVLAKGGKTRKTPNQFVVKPRPRR